MCIRDSYISLGSAAPYTTTNYPSGAKVFIDWNIDGDFTDIGEEIGMILNGSSTVNTPISFTVPTYAIGGTTRMRIVSEWNQDSGITSCNTAQWFGATEDYALSIITQIPVNYLWSTGDTLSLIHI